MTLMPSPIPSSSSAVDSAEGNAPSRSGKLRAFRYLRNHSGQSSKATQSAEPPPASTERSESRNNSHDARNQQPSTTQEQSPYEAWLESTYQTAHSPAANQNTVDDMAQGQSENAPQGSQGASEASNPNLQGLPQDQMPTIRLIPHHDPRSNRPSLAFPPTQRTLPHEECIIRVGRYSERDANPNPPANTPSSAPIGFKSKVVSRRHCEFWCSQGQWYIKDVKSSSGTFLNHIRLSQPNIESRPWPVNDGDVVQLGIDFRGGEEMIFRCVKIRVECNRAWQKTLNSYNVSTHKKLRDLGKAAPKKDSDAASSHSSECSICLMTIAPCQSLFVAPCSHVWHYKCIRPILNDHKTWPQFLCPNCRAVTDLEADIDDPNESWPDEEIDPPAYTESQARHPKNGPVQDVEVNGERPVPSAADVDLADVTGRRLSVREDHTLTPTVTTSSDPTGSSTSGAASLLGRRGAPPMPSPFAGPGFESMTATGEQVQYLRPITPTEPLMSDTNLDAPPLGTPTTEQLAGDGPMTPTNNAGPFVFDGSAGRAT